MYKVKTINEKVKTNKLKILDVMLKFKEPFKVDKDLSSKYVLRSLNLAHKLGLEENVIGIINCKINKKLLKRPIPNIKLFNRAKIGCQYQYYKFLNFQNTKFSLHFSTYYNKLEIISYD